mmetsp:Transcript_14775/g.2457  ORF Transcript_14775/g.2457 Transcript_14775/m.2457 type:complete len:82 (-) Transcript_14775:436-681(-)
MINYPYIQCISNITHTFINLAFILILRPFKEKLRNIFDAIGEFLILTIFIIVSFYLEPLEDEDKALYELLIIILVIVIFGI